MITYGPQIGKGGDRRYRIALNGRIVERLTFDDEAAARRQALAHARGDVSRVVRTVYVADEAPVPAELEAAPAGSAGTEE